MAAKHDLQDWVHNALASLGGSGSIVDVAKVIWHEHEVELKKSGNLLYTWQYDMRWAANVLRNTGDMKSVDISPRGVWELK